jgi:hypothetical protein
MKLSCYDHDGAKERSIAFGADFEATVDCKVCQNYADCKCNGTGWCVAEKATSTPIRHLWSVFVTSGSIMSTFFEDHLEKKKYVIVTATTRNKKLDSWFVVNFLMCCARIRKWHLECPLPLPISFDCIGRFSFWVSRLFIHSVGVEIGECAVGVVYIQSGMHIFRGLTGTIGDAISVLSPSYLFFEGEFDRSVFARSSTCARSSLITAGVFASDRNAF